MPQERLLSCDDEAAFGRFVNNVAGDLGYAVRVTTEGHCLHRGLRKFRADEDHHRDDHAQCGP